MKLINLIKYKLGFSIKSWNYYANPYYHWWKARKYFKRPRWHIVICGKVSWFFGMPIRKDSYDKLISIITSGLGWKDKYDSPRHEWDPYIAITLFRKWQIVWVFTYVSKNDEYSHCRNMATWEAILDYLYYDIPIDKIENRHTWKAGINEDDKLITIKENMKK